MSEKLKCSAESCYNNVNEFCVANTINVSGSSAHTTPETACDTFIQKTDAGATSHFTNRNLSDGFSQVFSGEIVETAPQIACEAENFTYNANRVCGAEYVEIHGPHATSSERTQCETFRED